MSYSVRKLDERKIEELTKLKDEESTIHILDTLEREYFVNEQYEMSNLTTNNILLLMKNDLCTFQEVVERFEKIRDIFGYNYVTALFKNKKLFQEMVECSVLDRSSLEYGLRFITNTRQLHELLENRFAAEAYLKNFIFSIKTAEICNNLIERDQHLSSNGVFTVCSLIAYKYGRLDQAIDFVEKILNLNKLNKFVYDSQYSDDKKEELSEILSKSEKARSILKQILTNNLESIYDFNELKRMLMKDDKKKKIKFNF